MKKLLLFFAAVLISASVLAEQKFSFVIEGSEQVYNQIRVVNRTSINHVRCRVVKLSKDNTIQGIYGVYDLNGYDDADSNSEKIKQGTKIGLQFPEDFTTELTFSVEYRDYPFFDAVVILLYDKNGEFNSEF